MSNKFLSKTVSAVSSVALAASMLAMPLVSHAASAGGVYSTPDGTVWFVTSDMQRRPFTSAGAFLSYGFLTWGQVMAADASVTALPAGSFIPPRDGSIFCATATKGTDVSGECALVTGGMKAAFTSAAVFGGLGYSFANAQYGDSSFLSKTSNIDNSSAAHSPGVLVNNAGTVQMVVSGGLWGVPSVDVFNSWYMNFGFAQVVPANAADKAMTQIGVIPARVAGQLNPTGITGGNPPPGDGTLGTGEGDITSVDEVSTSDSNIPEGDTGEVFGFTTEIEGDVQIDRIDVFMQVVTTAGTNSEDPQDYFDSAKLLVDGTEVADMDVSDFDDDSVWNIVTDGATTDDEFRLRFSNLALNFADGDEPEFVVSFDTNSVIDSGDLTADWTIGLADDSIRFVDGRGFSDTTGDSADPGGIEEDFGFENEEVAELNVQSSANDPEATLFEVSDTDTTDGVEIFVFEIEEQNGVDANVDGLTITVTSTVTADESAVMGDAHLMHGTDELDSVSVPSTGILVFENLDLDIDADGSEELSLEVDVEEMDGATLAEGATVTAAFTSIDDASDDNGNDEGDMTISGTPSSETHEFRTEGIMVEVTEADTDITNDDNGATFVSPFEFSWTVEITAFGDDVFINKDSADIVVSSTAGDVDQLYDIEESAGTAVTGSGTITSTADTATGDSGAYTAAYNGEFFFKILDGDTETFTITVTGVNSADTKQIRGLLNDIEWTTDFVDDTSGGSDAGTAAINAYTFNLGEDAATPYGLIH
jgi:hypothetical protein